MYIRIILRMRVRTYYMYGTTPKFKSTNIFISAARDQTAKFKDRQYFRLYGIYHCKCDQVLIVQRVRPNGIRQSGKYPVTWLVCCSRGVVSCG